MYTVDLTPTQPTTSGRERPLLADAALVKALFSGRQTRLRRPLKYPQAWGPAPVEIDRQIGSIGPKGVPVYGPAVTVGQLVDRRGRPRFVARHPAYPNACRDLISPYAPGDVLWVQETYSYITLARNEVRPGDPYAPSHGCHVRMFYRADDLHLDVPWVPAARMPRWASRLHLRLTDVYAQRVQSITPEQIVAEGYPDDFSPGYPEDMRAGALRLTYETGWNRRYAPRRPSEPLGPWVWSADPWTWVLSFVRIPSVQR